MRFISAFTFASAIFAEDFNIQLPNRNEIVKSLIGGIFMGFGAMIALGCTVGNLLSGIMAASFCLLYTSDAADE